MRDKTHASPISEFLPPGARQVPAEPRPAPRTRSPARASARSVTLVAALILGGLLALSSCNGRGWNGFLSERRGVDARREEEGPVAASVERLEIDNRFGPLRVQGGDELGWRWTLTCWADTLEEAETLLGEISLAVRAGDEGRVLALELVIPEPRPRALRGIESSLTVILPPRAQVKARNAFGSASFTGTSGGLFARCRHGAVEVRDVRGELDVANEFDSLSLAGIDGGRLANRHGAVEVEDAAGDVTISNGFGRIEARRIAGKLSAENTHGSIRVEEIAGRLDLETSFANLVVAGAPQGAELRNAHGSIEAQGLAGAIDARTSFGSLSLAGSPGEVDCRNHHGSIALSLGAAPCRVSARTSFGSVEVEAPPGVAARVEAEVSFGSIASELDAAPVIRNRNSQRLESGAAAAPLRLELAAEHGNVRLERRHD